VFYYNNSYYFISFEDGNIYEMNSKYIDFNGSVIPRIRIPGTIRLPDSSPFVSNNITFTMEQGQNSSIQRVDLSISMDGGESFSNEVGQPLNALGLRRNRIVFWTGGYMNEFTPQFRFWGDGRFVVTDGVVNIYQ
jgi:hypothetical protein